MTIILISTLKQTYLYIYLQAGVIAEISEAAFGWDSTAAGAAYRELGLRYAGIDDWTRAKEAYRKVRELCKGYI